MTVTREDFDAELTEFVAGIDEGRSLTGVGGGDNLFDAGVLDSFSVVRLIAMLERLTGRPIDLDRHGLDSFATADRIFETFVAAAAPERA